MAAITTVLTEFSDSANSRLYTAPSHTVSLPRVVVQRRRVPAAGNLNNIAQTEVNVSFGCVDADGAPMTQKHFIGATSRSPVGGDATNQAAALALFREIVASDEFAAAITTQNYLK